MSIGSNFTVNTMISAKGNLKACMSFEKRDILVSEMMDTPEAKALLHDDAIMALSCL